MQQKISNNVLLYGPPGTGKTYNTVNYAVAVIEGRPFDDIVSEGYDLALRKYDRYASMGRIGFMTFHQSLGYDDFIEGIKPVVGDGDGESLLYLPMPGTFYDFCRRAEFPRSIHRVMPDGFENVSGKPAVWLVTLGGPGDNDLRQECIRTDCIRLGWDDYGPDIGADMDFSAYGGRTELLNMTFNMQKGDIVLSMFTKDSLDAVGVVTGNCVFIIDEINRGNISKIFGELITLLESSRRKGMPECLEVFLPQMKKKFSIPGNVYVIGTMNTADKSLASLDTALRRRFEFIEMMPDPSVLRDRSFSEIDLCRLLETINNRVELLYDREHMLGHAYFISVRSMDDLAQCFIKKVIPLLQEYFFDDYEKICWVLGNSGNPRECAFIRKRKKNDFQTMFDLPDVFDIVEDENVFMNPESYTAIYSGREG